MFNFPYGIDVLDENNVVVSDSDNHSLRMITITDREDSKTKPDPKLSKAKKMEQDVKSEALIVLENLRNGAKEAAKGFRPYVIDILLGYTTNSPKQTLCIMLSLMHALLYGEKKRYESIIDIQTLLKKPSLKDDMMNLRIENVSQQNLVTLGKQLAILKKNDDCKVT